MLKLFGLLSLACWMAAAQYPPGQIPPSPGGYPPGTVPPPGQRPIDQGGADIPHPSRHKKGQKKEDTAKLPTIEADGVTVSNDGKKLVIHTEDGRWITMTLNPETKWTHSGAAIESNKIVQRTTVHVEAAEDDQAFLTAVHVDLLKDVPIEEANRSEPGSTEVSDDDLTRPTILHDPVAAPDRPILHRGKPKNSETRATQLESEQQSEAKPPSKKASSDDFVIADDKPVSAKRGGPGAELLERTTEWASTFTRGLPNFVCQQFTTRYTEVSRSEGWQAQDVLTAKVIYEDGREKYQDITVGGKKTNKSMMDLGGSTSTGEFASMLSSIFDPGRNTDFKFYRSTTLNNASAAIFNFSVALLRSDWTIIVGGQTLRPAYTGTVWVDKGSAQVRHIDLQAQNVPKDFPFDTIESSIDYDEVSFGTVKFLVPTHAENLSCERGSTFCNKNTIDFRDYHKYSGESTVTFK